MTPLLQQAAQAVIDRWDRNEYTKAYLGVHITALRKALEAEQAQAAPPRETDFQISLVKELADVKQSLLSTQGQLETSQKMLGNCHKELMTDAAAMMEADAQQVAVRAWKAEQIDEFEIRVKSPDGEAWRFRSADKNDIFNNFIWRWAKSIIQPQGDKT